VKGFGPMGVEAPNVVKDVAAPAMGSAGGTLAATGNPILAGAAGVATGVGRGVLYSLNKAVEQKHIIPKLKAKYKHVY
jgi:hypothetical protein